jgi:hypothetical protein
MDTDQSCSSHNLQVPQFANGLVRIFLLLDAEYSPVIV